ncbi:MAG TPA: Nif3-like dinuclear metal center hexameric protein [Gemmatimonadaceae bacterium]|nr:Nif3-like dinuclear metal center hexameric protein [Gemmatimonadaceae bacterium]
MPSAYAVAEFLDALLQTRTILDYPNAVNGLQLASTGEIRTVAAAVDYSTRAVQEAVRLEADLLLVHHGMFWGGAQPIVNGSYDRLSLLLANDVAVYSAHLPLDAHGDFGNSVLLARELGLDPTAGFARFQSIDVGVSGRTDLPTMELVERARRFAHTLDGTVVVTPFDTARRTSHWGICSGAGASSATIAEALSAGIDTLIVGEGPHHTAVQARDAGLVIIYAGHYATETLGVRALARALEREFGTASLFIHAPTGL